VNYIDVITQCSLVDLCVENYEFSKHDPLKMHVNVRRPHEFGAYTGDTPRSTMKTP